MRFIAPKSVAQQDLLALHRVRARLLRERIGQSNLIRALLTSAGWWRGWARPDCVRRDAGVAGGEPRAQRCDGRVAVELSGGLREMESRFGRFDLAHRAGGQAR